MNQSNLEALKDLEDQDFQRWRHHPVTQVFLAFLKDQAETDRQTLLALWEARNLDPDKSAELRGRVLVLDELQELTLSSIKMLEGIEVPTPAEEEQQR